MKKVLITGASGFLGYHLIESALARGYEVTAAVRRSSNIGHLSHLPVSVAYLNLADKSSLNSELQKGQYDFVIHNAGATRADSEEEFLKANALTTKNLAEVALENRVSKFIFISSLAAYGPKESIEEGFVKETDVPKPVTSYGRSKLKAEEYLRQVPNLNYIIFRPTAVYGPREKDLLIVFQNVNKGLETYIGKKPQLLSFVYGPELAQLVVFSLESGVTNKSYFVSDGKSYDQYQLASVAKKMLGKKTIKLHVPVPMVRVIASALESGYALLKKGTPVLNKDRINELTGRNWTCDIQATKEDFGFSPQYTLEEGLRETLTWYKQNNWI